MNSSDFRTEARNKLAGKWKKAVLITLAYAVVFLLLGFVQGLLDGPAELKSTTISDITYSTQTSNSTPLGSIFSLISTIIEIPLSFGIIASFMKLYDDEETKAFDFISLGFNNFKKSWGVSLQIFLKMLVPFIILIVSIVLMGVGIAGGISSATLGYKSVGSFGIVSTIAFALYIFSIIWLITKSYYYQLAMFIAIDNPGMTSKEAVEKSAVLMQNNRAKLFWLQLSFIGWAFLTVFTFGIGALWLFPYIQCALIAFYKERLGNLATTKPEENSEIKTN